MDRVRGRAQRDARLRAAAKFRNAAISGAFNRWAEFADERKEMRSLLERAAAKFQKRRTISGAFSRWVEFADERKGFGL